MKILVVEDEHRIASAIRTGLEEENYVVDISHDGDDGYGMANTQEYDLLVLDRMLPGDKDGIDIARQLRAENNHTPILILTARGETSDKVDGLEAGADDYLTKPFAFEELLARVRALLRRPKQARDEILTTKSLSMDTINLTVTRYKKQILLSKKEFMLLEYLLRNQSHILSKDRIIKHVWDYDADILPNTVEAHIKYLREKIEKPFKGPKLIHTVHGMGYKLEEQG
jgi:DNA-binding response OmpR family regulator